MELVPRQPNKRAVAEVKMGHHKKNHVISNAGTKKSAERKWRRKEKAFLKGLATTTPEKSSDPKMGTENPGGSVRKAKSKKRTRRDKAVVSIYSMLHSNQET